MRNKNKKFPYPVLSKDTEDIINSSLGFKYTVVEDQDFRCHVKVDLVNRSLKKLIKDEKAAIAIHIECPKTRYREIKLFRDFEFE